MADIFHLAAMVDVVHSRSSILQNRLVSHVMFQRVSSECDTCLALIYPGSLLPTRSQH